MIPPWRAKLKVTRASPRIAENIEGFKKRLEALRDVKNMSPGQKIHRPGLTPRAERLGWAWPAGPSKRRVCGVLGSCGRSGCGNTGGIQWETTNEDHQPSQRSFWREYSDTKTAGPQNPSNTRVLRAWTLRRGWVRPLHWLWPWALCAVAIGGEKNHRSDAVGGMAWPKKCHFPLQSPVCFRFVCHDS